MSDMPKESGAGNEHERPRLNWRQALALLPVGAVLALLLVMRMAGLLQPLELMLYDRFLAWRSGPLAEAPKVAIVYFEDADLARWGWPVSDQRLAELIVAVQGAGAALVGLDVYRDRAIPPGEETLAAVFQGREPVVGTSLFARAGENGVAPPPALSALGRFGFSDMPLDPDRRVRRGLLYLDDGSTVVPGFALRSVQAWMEIQGSSLKGAEENPRWLQIGAAVYPPLAPDFGAYAAIDARGYQLLFDYKRSFDSFPAFSVTHVLAEAPEALAGRIVLIGAITQSAKDYFVAPLPPPSGQALTPGIYLHAALIDQMLRQASGASGSPRSLDERSEVLLILAVGMLAALLSTRLRSTALQLGWPLVAAGLTAIACYGLFLKDLWLPGASLSLSSGFTALTITGQSFLAERRKRAALMRLFESQVSHDVAEKLWRERHVFLDGGRPKAIQTRATVMFVDLAGSTGALEELGAAKGMEWLSRYLQAMADVALEHHGFIEKFTGDGLMVVFGAPVEAENEATVQANARQALACAKAMRAQLGSVNRELNQQGLPRMRLRIGIDSGPVSAGLVGSRARMQYTVLGDPANTAARLESHGKDDPAISLDAAGRPLTCRVLLSDETARLSGARDELEPMGELALRGKQGPQPIFRLRTEAEMD